MDSCIPLSPHSFLLTFSPSLLQTRLHARSHAREFVFTCIISDRCSLFWVGSYNYQKATRRTRVASSAASHSTARPGKKSERSSGSLVGSAVSRTNMRKVRTMDTGQRKVRHSGNTRTSETTLLSRCSLNRYRHIIRTLHTGSRPSKVSLRLGSLLTLTQLIRG